MEKAGFMCISEKKIQNVGFLYPATLGVGGILGLIEPKGLSQKVLEKVFYPWKILRWYFILRESVEGP